MRLSRFLPGVLAAALSVALVGGSPARAVAPAGDPLATTVTGACSGGPGRVSLRVHAPVDGAYRVRVIARGLAEGSRWTVSPAQVPSDAQEKDFRRVSVDGRWTVRTRFPAPSDPENEVYFAVYAQERGERSHRCLVLNSQASPVAGLAECNNRRQDIVVLARERDNDSTVVRSIIGNAPTDSRWHLTLTATGAADRQTVEFNDTADRREGVVRSRVVITGVRHPQLRLVASNKDQGRCFIGLDPPAATTVAPLTLRGLGKLNDYRA